MRFNCLADWLAWQETLHPKTIDLGLERVREVALRLDLLPVGCPVITVAGTNGKGSCVAMLEAMLRAAGYRVGSYTSPHLLRYNERIRIDGGEAEDAEICAAFERIDRARGGVSLSYFEFGTLAALEVFVRAQVDVMVLEVGLGGRLDAVNIVDADVAIVASVGTDHKEWLGEGREAVGAEKAGIFRSGHPAICGDPEPPASVAAMAREVGAELLQFGQDFHAIAAADPGRGWSWSRGRQRLEGLPLPGLSGRVQLGNAACCITALTALGERLTVGRAAIEAGLEGASLPGRFQRIPGPVETVLDIAHNAEAATALADALDRVPVDGRTLAVFAALADKDLEAIVGPLMPLVSRWYVGPLGGPRGRPARETADALLNARPGAVASVHGSLGEAYAAARREACDGDRILVFGSFYTVAEVLAELV